MALAKLLTKAEIESLYSGANSAVWQSHCCAGITAKRPPREEDYVATLVTKGVSELAERWSEILSPKGVALQVAGVFCHGHPQVKFGVPASRVELADLLILHRHSAKARSTTRAMLIQAKMSTDLTHPLPKGDSQLTLYSTWPQFSFVTGGLDGRLRNIQEKGKGSRYALIQKQPTLPSEIRWADQCPWASSPARPVLAAERSFAKLLGDMLLGKDGRPVHLAKPKDEWSKTIKELLVITGARTFRRMNIGLNGMPRLSVASSAMKDTLFLAQSPTFASRRIVASPTQFFFAQAKNQDAQSVDHGNEPPRTDLQSNSDGGMSVLIIETHSDDPDAGENN